MKRNVNKTPPDESIKRDDVDSMRREGNACLGLGAGVGAFGAGSAVFVGATCPLCYIVAPALIGMGVYGRMRARRLENKSSSQSSE